MIDQGDVVARAVRDFRKHPSRLPEQSLGAEILATKRCTRRFLPRNLRYTRQYTDSESKIYEEFFGFRFKSLFSKVTPTPELCRRLADRRFGVGYDQILLVEQPRSSAMDFYYRIFNADGSEVEQCGNGARCFARFVTDQGLTTKRALSVGTAAGDIKLYLEENDLVRVDMGIPRFEPEHIPFVADAAVARYPLEVEGRTLNIGAVSMGNPHAVLQVEDLAATPVPALGALIEGHPRFPQRVNAGFMQVLDAGNIRLRVYKRGVGETLACGTGACAAVAVGRRWGLLAERVRVNLPGGELVIEWPDESGTIRMTGPAVSVFEGEFEP